MLTITLPWYRAKVRDVMGWNGGIAAAPSSGKLGGLAGLQDVCGSAMSYACVLSLFSPRGVWFSHE
jgi:hypothetical protein